MTGRLGWKAIAVEPGVVHVVPALDVVDHTPDLEGDCVCGPDVTLANSADDDGDVWIHVHHALDGRPAPKVGKELHVEGDL